MLEFKSEHSRSYLPLSLLEQVPRKTRQFRAVLSELLVVTNMFALFFHGFRLFTNSSLICMNVFVRGNCFIQIYSSWGACDTEKCC